MFLKEAIAIFQHQCYDASLSVNILTCPVIYLSTLCRPHQSGVQLNNGRLINLISCATGLSPPILIRWGKAAWSNLSFNFKIYTPISYIIARIDTATYWWKLDQLVTNKIDLQAQLDVSLSWLYQYIFFPNHLLEMIQINYPDSMIWLSVWNVIVLHS